MRIFLSIGLMAFATHICGGTAAKAYDLDPTALQSRTVQGSKPHYSCRSVKAPRSTCGVEGYVNGVFNNFLAGNSTVDSVAACREVCGHRVYGLYGCKYFLYNQETGQCSLSSNTLAGDGFRADNTSVTLAYDSQCFSCPPLSCPDTGALNLIDNGGFEFSTNSIGPWTPDSRTMVVSPGYKSSNALLCIANAACEIYSYRDECFGQMYAFSAIYKIVRNPGQKYDGFLDISLGDSGDLDLYIEMKSSNASFACAAWHHLYFTYFSTSEQTGGLATLSFYFGSYMSTQNHVKAPLGIYIDNVKVTSAPSTFNTIGENLVPNGNFESGSPEPWKVSDYDYYCEDCQHYHEFLGNSSIASPGLTDGSKYSLEYSGGKGANFIIQSSSFETTIGKTYLCSFAYKQDEFVVQLFIDGKSTSKSPIQYTLPYSINKTTLDQRVFTAQTKVSSLYFSFTGMTNRKAYAFLDDVSVFEVVL